MKRHYDRIVIVCAPNQAVSDALVLSGFSDAVVYCVKSHHTSIELVRRGLQRLRQVDAPLAGVVITQVDMDKLQSYGGDYYYQGYYDYYGYSDKSEHSGDRKIRLTQTELHEIRNDDRDVDLGLDVASNGATQVAAGWHANGNDRTDINERVNGNGRNDGNERVNGNGRANTADLRRDEFIDLDMTTELDISKTREILRSIDL